MPRSGRKETELGSLILKRANNSRLSGRWSDDDYDVLENGVVVGRLQGAGPAAESALDVGERS